MRKTSPKNNNKIWELREAYGFTRPQFSKIVGISVSSLQAYEENRNQLTTNAKNKIARTTGIPTSYFELDSISAKEAIEQSKLSADDLLRANKEVNYCTLYSGLNEFLISHPQNYYYDNTSVIKPLEINTTFLNTLFELEDGLEYAFIKVKGNEAEPFATNGQTLIVKSVHKSITQSNDEIINNNEWLIVQSIAKGSVFVRQYRLLSKNVSNVSETTITDSDLDDVHILGIIKAKISLDKF